MFVFVAVLYEKPFHQPDLALVPKFFSFYQQKSVLQQPDMLFPLAKLTHENICGTEKSHAEVVKIK